MRGHLSTPTIPDLGTAAGPAANRALIIDDDVELGAVIARVARGSGYDAIVTDDPADFLHKAREWSPTLLIVDLMMPDLDGIGLIRRLGHQRTPAAVLLISGANPQLFEQAQDIGAGLGLRMAGRVQKPFRTRDLSDMLRGLLHDVPATPARIRDGLAAGEFSLVYQPKFEMASGRLVGAEALMRWEDPRHGTIPPAVFIPVAEQHGLISDLTRWAIDSVSAQQAAWGRAGASLNVALNVTRSDLESGCLHEDVRELSGRHGTDPHDLTFEISEAKAVRDEQAASFALVQLRLIGVRIAIDDFGSGYSSLVRLQRDPLSELKIDRTFVADCTRSRESRIIIKAIIDLAHNLGLAASAVGAETEAQIRVLRELGCDYVQGDAISPPLEAAELTALHPA